MTDLGEPTSLLGRSIIRNRDKREVHINQVGLIKKILLKFSMEDANPQSTPVDTQSRLVKGQEQESTDFPYAQAVGSLMYVMTATRPDIAYSVSLVSRYLSNPSSSHVTAVKRITRYLKQTINLNLTYKAKITNEVIGYCYSDYASDPDDSKSVGGYAFLYGGAAISWNSKKQPNVATSSCEAEYMALSAAAKEALWIKKLLNDLRLQIAKDPITIYCDNMSAISLAHNPVCHQRSKHIRVAYHFFRDEV